MSAEIADIVIVGEGEIAFNQMVFELEKADYKLENKKVYKGKSINFSDLKSPYSIDYFNDVEGKVLIISYGAVLEYLYPSSNIFFKALPFSTFKNPNCNISLLSL